LGQEAVVFCWGRIERMEGADVRGRNERLGRRRVFVLKKGPSRTASSIEALIETLSEIFAAFSVAHEALNQKGGKT
jgi:hypothetical protein